MKNKGYFDKELIDEGWEYINKIDKSISEYDKSMKEIFRLLDENAKIISDLQDDVNKMRSVNNEN